MFTFFHPLTLYDISVKKGTNVVLFMWIGITICSILNFKSVLGTCNPELHSHIASGLFHAKLQR